MAFNRQTFKTRALTAIVFVVVMLAGLFINRWSFLILFSIIHFGCWWEYLQLTEKIHKTSFHIQTKMGLMVMGYGIMLWFCGQVYNINSYGLKENLSLPVSAAGFTLLLSGIFSKNRISIKGFGMALFGLAYISLCWGSMMHIYSYTITAEVDHFKWETISFATLFPVLIIACMWINDTMAYIVGSLMGKTPLSKISPKKTWEGTIGGIVLTVIIVGLSAPYFFRGKIEKLDLEISTYHWFLIPAIAAIVGTFGDLFESKLKRMAAVKDSGSLMPGHGGFLDRFDSLLFATPAVWLYLYLLAPVQ